MSNRGQTAGVTLAVLLSVALCGSCFGYSSIWYSGEQDIQIGPGGGVGSQLTFFLDLNHDTLTDFGFGYTPWEFAVHPDNGGRTVVTDDGDYVESVPLDSGVEVGETLPAPETWNEDVMQLVVWLSLPQGTVEPAGPWTGIARKYLGVSAVTAEGDTYYGWVQLSASRETETATIHDWAYETMSGQSIMTGVIPEPSSLWLFAVGACALLGLRRAGHGGLT